MRRAGRRNVRWYNRTVGSKFVWFLLGVATGAVAIAALKRVQENQEVEDVESIANSISERLDQLEGKSLLNT